MRRPMLLVKLGYCSTPLGWPDSVFRMPTFMQFGVSSYSIDRYMDLYPESHEAVNIAGYLSGKDWHGPAVSNTDIIRHHW